MTSPTDLDAFIARWAASGAAERANFQTFANELCDLLGVEKPLPAGGDAAADAYVFEKPVPLAHGTTGFIDLYRRLSLIHIWTRTSESATHRRAYFTLRAMRFSIQTLFSTAQCSWFS